MKMEAMSRYERFFFQFMKLSSSRLRAKLCGDDLS
jgi:hypothetical protein